MVWSTILCSRERTPTRELRLGEPSRRMPRRSAGAAKAGPGLSANEIRLGKPCLDRLTAVLAPARQPTYARTAGLTGSNGRGYCDFPHSRSAIRPLPVSLHRHVVAVQVAQCLETSAYLRNASGRTSSTSGRAPHAGGARSRHGSRSADTRRAAQGAALSARVRCVRRRTRSSGSKARVSAGDAPFLSPTPDRPANLAGQKTLP